MSAAVLRRGPVAEWTSRGTASLALLALLSAGCSARTVDGSLGELVNLTYQDERFLFQPPVDFTRPLTERLEGLQRMSVRYTTPQGDGENTIWSVTIYVGDLTYGVDWLVGTELDLAARGQVSRNVLNEPGRTWPDLERGTFVLHTLPFEGRPMTGSFSATFENGTAFASGRTVFHSFSAEIEQP